MQSDKKAGQAAQNTPPAEKKTVAAAKPQKVETARKATPKSAKKATSKTTPKSATKTTAKSASKKAPAKSTKAAGKLTLRFEIYFSTRFGQSICISGAHPALGSEATEDAPVMTFIDDQIWAIQLELDKSSLKNGQLEYTYLVRDENGSLTLSAPYQLEIPTGASTITIRDAWNSPGYIENALGTNAMQVIAGQFTPKTGTSSRKKFTHRFSITTPAIASDKAICLIGEAAALGSWNPAKALVLTQQAPGKWSIDLTLKGTDPVTAYKYGIYDLATGQLESYESGDNRRLTPDTSGAQLLILQDGFIRTN